MVALLAGGGTILFWMSGFGDAEPPVRADAIGDLCETVVDQELLTPWADAELERESSDTTGDEIRTFECSYSAEHTGDDAYRLVTLFATVQVYESEPDAKAAHAGLLEFEASEGHAASSVSGVADRAAMAVLEGVEETELRLHAQEANATVTLSLFLTGEPPEGVAREQLAKDLSSGAVDALPRDGN
ncbi:hypothetical protein GCM10027447_39200 [Glycomyces halotolerans]